MLSSALNILFPKPKFKVSLSPSWVKKEPWKKVKPSSLSTSGLRVKIPICGFSPSVDLIDISVFSKLSFKKLSIELKKLDLILEVSATDTVDEKIKAYNVIRKYFFIKTLLYILKN